MKIKKIAISTLAIIYLSVESLQAQDVDIAKELRNIGGIYANQTNPTAWKDPSTGINYYSGGSLEVRFKGSNNSYAPWIDARGPSLKSGCSGFSFDAGFASIIDLNGITSQLSQAGTSIVGGFMSSILYATPILGDIITTVKRIATEIQKMLQNACNVGKKLGTASSDYLSDFMKDHDLDKYVTEVKDYGNLKAVNKWIVDHTGTIQSAMKCLGSSNVSGKCFSLTPANASKDDAAANANVKTIINSINSKTTKGDVQGGILTDVATNTNFHDKFWIDSISLEEFLIPGSNKDSKKGKFKLSDTLVQYRDNKFAQLLFLIERPSFSSPKVCEDIIAYYKAMDSGADSQTLGKAMNKIKTEMQKTPNAPSEKIESGGGSIGIKAGKNAFSPTDSLTDYILYGNVQGNQLSVQNANIYVVNEIKQQSDKGSSDTYQVTYLCNDAPSTKKDFYLTWGGIPSIQSVQTEIEKIAGIRNGARNTNVIITAEAAKLAQYLSEKNKIEKYGYGAIAPSITSYKIAKLNNYFLVSSIYSALRAAEYGTNSTIGKNVNAMLNNDALAKSLKIIETMREKMEKDMKKIFAKDFADATIRDAENVHRKYKELSRKRTFNH